MSAASTVSVSLRQRVQRVLSQDRHVLNFQHYKVSSTHVTRMQHLAKTVPELYNNPSITPRSKWFQHPKWNENSQMPPFHVHFRSELQSAVRTLYEALELTTTTTHQQQQKQQIRLIQRANDIFRGSMRGLNGHVSIEEYACFPLYKQTFPTVDISFLIQDHEHLHESERNVYNAFDTALTRIMTKDTKDDNDNVNIKGNDDQGDNDNTIITTLESTLNQLLDFDDELMAHLGEEEEIVVPMSLTEKEIWF